MHNLSQPGCKSKLSQGCKSQLPPGCKSKLQQVFKSKLQPGCKSKLPVYVATGLLVQVDSARDLRSMSFGHGWILDKALIMVKTEHPKYSNIKL